MKTETIRKLQEMKLGVMADAYMKQAEHPDIYAPMGFDDRLAVIVDCAHDAWENSNIAGRIRRAKFPESGISFSDIRFLPDRHLDAELMRSLCTNAYIRKNWNVIFLGATGTGKSFLATVLGIEACKDGVRVRYLRLPEFFSEYAAAEAAHKEIAYLKFLLKVPLLIVDDFLLFPANEEQQRIILELAESRNGRASTIFCSQFDIEGWHANLGGGVVADSVLDRIKAKAYVIELKGDSMRSRLKD